MTTRFIAILAPLAIGLAGCATNDGLPSSTEVIRYHLGQPIAPGTVAIEPLANSMPDGPEARLYGDAVASEMARIGFAPAPSGSSSQYVAGVSFVRAVRGTVRTPPKFTIGLGGGSYGGNVGVGGGLSTGIGSKTRDVIASELTVQIRRRSDGTMIWEGRAQRMGLGGGAGDQPIETAERMANALFRGFPGESGITTTVP